MFLPNAHAAGGCTPLKNDYGNQDFVLRLALSGREDPIDWWEEIKQGNIPPEEQVVTQDARQLFGIQYGFSVPVLDGTFAIAGISVITQNADHEHYQALKQANMKRLWNAARTYHTHIMGSIEALRFFIAPLLGNLTETKKKVLRHKLSGQPMKSIPHTMGVTQRYAENVLAELRREFGVRSTDELMYILGVINIHRFL
jgi:hypothetical protein